MRSLQTMPFNPRALGCLTLLGACLLACPADSAEPTAVLDLLTYGTPSGGVTRVYGADGFGGSGTPVAGGIDCDGDGHQDYGFAGLRSSPLGRFWAGEVRVIFGDGTIGGEIDSAGFCPRILKIAGDQVQEVAGTEIWLDDVTGDGIGDVMIGRQNYTPQAGREGAGALSILIGGASLRAAAEKLQYFDLQSPSTNVTMLTIAGAKKYDRMGIWMRGGDVTGDGIQDVIVAADQEDFGGETERGAVYVIRGGPHLATNATIDITNVAGTALSGHVACIRPPPGSEDYHLGSSLQAADVDGNGYWEVFMSAALARSGAGICHPSGGCTGLGGAPLGKLFIAWDDLFPTNNPWTNGLVIDLGLAAHSGSVTVIQGALYNDAFGEEILGGLDYDGDGATDLFVGDLTADITNGANAGTGHVFYNAPLLKGLHFGLTDPTLPSGLVHTLVLGPFQNALGGDTIAQADYDLDGYGDLAFGNPHDWPQGRVQAGSMHVLYGQPGGWPSLIDLKAGNLPDPSVMRILRVEGAYTDDVLCYSAAVGDLDEDGRPDIIVNEMKGNGAGGTPVNVGNLLLISGAALLSPEPPISTLAITGNVLRIRAPMIPGESYAVECTTNVLLPTWIEVTNGLTGTNVVTEVDLPIGPDVDRYYRLALAPKSMSATNRCPIAKFDATNTAQNTAVLVRPILNDSDPDGDAFFLGGAATSSWFGGSIATNTGGTATYTPPLNFTGVDAFDYWLLDGNGGVMTGCVNISVSP